MQAKIPALVKRAPFGGRQSVVVRDRQFISDFTRRRMIAEGEWRRPEFER